MSFFVDRDIQILEPECPYNGCYGTIVRCKDFPDEFHCIKCGRKVIINTEHYNNNKV